MNWHELIQGIMGLAEENITIEKSEPIILTVPKYYKEIFNVLKQQEVR
jgi:hypothetical protein